MDQHSNQHICHFNQYRTRLLDIAYRMLGTRADAEDVLQDAYLRWHDTPPPDNLDAWLVAVECPFRHTARIAVPVRLIWRSAHHPGRSDIPGFPGHKSAHRHLQQPCSSPPTDAVPEAGHSRSNCTGNTQR